LEGRPTRTTPARVELEERTNKTQLQQTFIFLNCLAVLFGHWFNFYKQQFLEIGREANTNNQQDPTTTTTNDNINNNKDNNSKTDNIFKKILK
jgi:hypothetical protein